MSEQIGSNLKQGDRRQKGCDTVHPCGVETPLPTRVLSVAGGFREWTPGMCPFCDAERGIGTAWRMSETGWRSMLEGHRMHGIKNEGVVGNAI